VAGSADTRLRLTGPATSTTLPTKLPAFRHLVQEYDRGGKFSNEFVATYIKTA
jgi:hypothetical protein